MRPDLNIDFIGKSKIYYTISLTLITLGILVSIIFGVKLDIQFTGGAIIRYTYTGDVSTSTAQQVAQSALPGKLVDASTDVNYVTHQKTLVLDINKNLTSDEQSTLFSAESKQFSGNQLAKGQSTDVAASMGRAFFQKSLLALVLASVLIILYIWIRFRKIGGLPAGIFAFVALMHDVIIGFVAFSVMRFTINDNFVAVTLTILGYSINDTIVVFDRVRENRRLYGQKIPFKDIVNKSINQSFARSINTTLVTFVAIAVIAVFSFLYRLDSLTSFALPMMVGVVTGCYSTICIAGPLWVTWETHKEKRAAAAKLVAAQEREEHKKRLEAARTGKKNKR